MADAYIPSAFGRLRLPRIADTVYDTDERAPFRPIGQEVIGATPVIDAINQGLIGQAPQQTGGTNLLGVPTSTPTDYRAMMTGAQRAGGRAGLAGMLMGLASPVRRGESRLMKSVALGQQMSKQAQADQLSQLTTKMKVDEFQRAQDLKARKAAILAGQGGSQPSQGIDTSELIKNVSYLPESNQRFFADSLSSMSKANQFMRANMPAEAEEMMNLAKQQREAAFSGQIDPAKRTELELSENENFKTKIYKPRAEIVNAYNEMVAQYEGGGGINDYALMVKYIKSLDPTSVVRGSEVEMADQFKGLEARFNELLKRAQGEGFDDSFRKAMLASARQNALVAQKAFNDDYTAQMEVYTASGLRPERIVGESMRGIEVQILPFDGGQLTFEDRNDLDKLMSADLGGET